jgi:predicted choloylglycine hydrolase
MYHPRLQGAHYTMGYHYGELMHKKGVSLNEVMKLTEEQLEFGKTSLKICEKYVPNICLEIKGLSDGLKCSFELLASWLLTLYNFGDVHGCTCFCFISHNKAILGRNSDMLPSMKKTSESVIYRPDEGYRFLGHSTALISMEDGINEHGLAVGMNFLATRQMKPGLNTGILIRHILESCKTVDEAINFLQEVPISSTQNIMLMDKSNNSAVVECSPQYVVIRRPVNDEHFLVSANHFISNEIISQHANPMENWFHSYDRYNTAYTALSNDIPPDCVKYTQEILRGDYGFMCQYKKDLNFQTIWSVVYDVSNLKIYCSEGNPNTTEFKEDTRLDWCISRT